MGSTGVGSRSGPPIRLGVIGLGYWGPNLARVVADDEAAELAWLCDQDEERLVRQTRRYPTARGTTEAEDLFDADDLDAVLIATPVFSHAGLVRSALEAGKHVMVEKPLASSAEIASELLADAQRRDQVLMCGHTFLYSPPVRVVKSLLEQGELGELYFVSSSRVNLGLHQSDVSVIWDLGPHDFSILRFWLGENPDEVSAMGRDSVLDGVADVAFVNLSFPSGVLANVEMSWLAPSKLRRTVLVGSHKMIVYEDGASEPVRIFDHGVELGDPESFGQYQLSYRTGDIVSPRVDTIEPLAAQLTDFLHAIAAGRAPDGHGELCRDVVALIEAADHSLELGGGKVSLAEEGLAL